MTDIGRIAKEVFAADDRYPNVGVAWAPFGDIQVMCCRDGEEAQVLVSDYLEDAPEDVVEGVLRRSRSNLNGGKLLDYPECVFTYLRTLRTREDLRRRFIGRNLIDVTGDWTICIDESMERLREVLGDEACEDVIVGVAMVGDAVESYPLRIISVERDVVGDPLMLDLRLLDILVGWSVRDGFTSWTPKVYYRSELQLRSIYLFENAKDELIRCFYPGAEA